jgi:ubiquinone/menaquinone biosynthesis C-methylase UbiE
MGWYSTIVFPCGYDWLMDKPFWIPHRRQQLATASGRILEVGAGTGLNLPHYPEQVTRITTVDPNPGMNRRLQLRSERTGIHVDQRIACGETLPFQDESFDCVVSTVTLCSMTDVRQALSECFRVLKPEGRFLFLEHGISPDAGVLKWQRRLDGLQRRLADGCTLLLDVRHMLSTQPFDDVQIESFYLPRIPRTHGYMYRGVATK